MKTESMQGRSRLGGRFIAFFALLIAIPGSTSNVEAVYSLPSDRVVKWQGNIGLTYRGGIPPRTTVCATINSRQYGDGVADATSAINNAILSCPNGQTVYIPAGTYRLNSGLTIPKTKSITLRGAGPGVTILQSYSTNSDLNAAAIKIGDFPKSLGRFSNPNYCPQVAAPAGYVQNITGGAGRASTRITLADASMMNVGDLGVINVLNNNDSSADLWIQSTNIGQEGPSSIYGFCCSTPATCRSLGQVVEVTGKEGNTITVSPPLYTDYSVLQSPQFSRIAASDVVKNVGIEDLTIDNAAGTSGVNSLIYILSSYNVWLRNIETNRARGRHVWIKFINLFTEVRDSYFHDSLTFASNNYGINIEQWGSGWLIENNRFKDTMIPIMLGTSASGGVAGYNYIGIVRYTVSLGWLMMGISQHAAGAWMNLAEGNYLTKIGLDQIHGTNYYFTAFRNDVRYDAPPNDGYAKTNAVSLMVDRGSRLHNIVGNVLGYSGFPWRYQWNGEACTNAGSAIYKFGYNMSSDCNPANWDPKTAATTLRHGNYDYVNQSVIWNGSDDHVLPPSLYLSSKPSWWGTTAWPPIGPDLSPMVSSIPARDRYLGATAPSKRPSPPRLNAR